MFSDHFIASVEEVKIKRLKEELGGGLMADVKIRTVLTPDMATDLGQEVVSFINTGLLFKSALIESANEGLLVEVWHAEQTDLTTGPYLTLTGVSTKKYKLTRDDDTGAVTCTLEIKKPSISESDMVKLLQCLDRSVSAKIDFAQRSLL